MGKHQLFKETPPLELVVNVVQCFGFENLKDKGCICKKYFTSMNVIEKLIIQKIRIYLILIIKLIIITKNLFYNGKH